MTFLDGIALGNLCVSYRPSNDADAPDVIGPGNRVCTAREEIHSRTAPNPIGYTNVMKFFNDPEGDFIYYWPRTVAGDEDKQIHRGDFVRYGTTHISTVHTPKADCNTDGKNCTYKIIHAYGEECTEFDEND